MTRPRRRALTSGDTVWVRYRDGVAPAVFLRLLPGSTLGLCFVRNHLGAVALSYRRYLHRCREDALNYAR